MNPRHTTALLALATLIAGWPIHFLPHLHTANEAIRLYFVQAVVDTHAVALDPICAIHGSVPVDRAEEGGRILMDKAPGLSLLLLPVYALLQAIWPAVRRQDLWLLGYVCVWVGVLLPVSASLLALAGWLRRRRVTEPAVALTLLLLLLGSPLLVYAGLLFGHGLAAALVALAFFGLAGAANDAPSWRRRLFCGLAAGYAGVVDTPVFLLAALLCVYALAREPLPPLHRLRWALPFVLGVAACAVLQLGYNAAVFGAPWSFAYGFKADANLAKIHGTGFLGFTLPGQEALYGLSLGAARGLFYHAPWLVLAVAGLVGQARRRLDVLDAPADLALRRDARWLLVVSAAYFAIIASFVDWRAGDAAGARHLVPIVALLGAGLPFALPAARWASAPWSRSLATAAAAVACTVGVLLHLPTAASFPYHFDKLNYPVFELSWPLVTYFGSYSPSLGSLLGLSGAWSFALQLCLVGSCFGVWSRFASGGAASQVASVSGAEARDLGTIRTFGLALTLGLLWLAAVVAPLGKPGRAVQAARLLATTSLDPGLASRSRFADDPEGKVLRPMPSRERPKTKRERMRAARAAARQATVPIPAP